MKIIKLLTNPILYSSNAYLIFGAWNKIDDVNALIDTGSDGYIIDHIDRIIAGVDKNRVEKIILTHSHFDHIGGVRDIKKKYKSEVLASISAPFVDKILEPGENILLGDCYFEVIHTPGHSPDSISLYCKSEGVLFTGDLNLRTHLKDNVYSAEYIESMEKIARLKINVIFPGHGEPIDVEPEKFIQYSLQYFMHHKTTCTQ